MNNKAVLGTALSVALIFSTSAFANEVDQSQVNVNAFRSAGAFAPLGQSFIPTVDSINGVSFSLVDPGGFGYGSTSVVNLRRDNMEGEIVATSQSVFLEDCFNFEEGPGCNTGGGYGAEVFYNFGSSIGLEVGQVYVVEIVVEAGGDGLNAGYVYDDNYVNGGLYTSGVLQNNDLFFKTHYSSEAEHPNILVSNGTSVTAYTSGGTYVAGYTVDKNGSSEVARDIIKINGSTTAVFNGTFQPQLSINNDGQWSHQTFDGWSIPNNGTYGGIAYYDSYIYVTDGSTSGKEAKGIIKFDISGQQPTTRYLDGNEYIDVTLGLDNKLYALRNSYGDLDIVDPVSMSIINSVDLGHTSSSRAVTADASGNIYMASWNGNLYQYDSNGVELAFIDISNDLYDIDIDASGTIIVSDRSGRVFITDTNLRVPSEFSAGSSGVFVAFDVEKKVELPIEYCESSTVYSSKIWNESIEINGQEFVSGNNAGYYNDSSNLIVLSKLNTQTLTLNPAFKRRIYSVDWVAWIDFNHNGEFEVNEEVLSDFSNSSVTSFFDVPANAKQTETRLRVSMRYAGVPSACGVYKYGEVEDYRVIITND